VRYIEGINSLGVDPSDPNAQDDKVVSELHLPKGKKIHFKIRSQDVLHSAYMPHFRAQMNCVPGMVTEFAYTPIYTSDEYRNLPYMIEKVNNINSIRTKKSAELVALGQPALDPYTFDFLLLCNKICGASHYNMQMKIVVDTPEDYKKWLKEKATFSEELKSAATAASDEKNTKEKDTTVTVASDKMMVQVEKK
jgi:cytochrome c oxidase subunit 2